MGRKKNPNSVSNYFDESVETAIHLYNKAETERERNRLFSIIYPALSKVSEVFYNKIKPTYIEGDPIEIQMDCIAYLSERLFRIKEGKGKAFSYMTVCARNFYIFHNMKGYKDVQKTLTLDSLHENWDVADDSPQRLEEIQAAENLLSAFTDYLEKNKNSLRNSTKKSENMIDGIIELLRNVDDIQNLNRRDIMNSLVDVNGIVVDRHYVTKMFNMITMHYDAFKREWIKTGKSIEFIDKQELTPSEAKYCIENYSQADRKFGVIALARKFSVPEYSIRKELSKAGLCTI
jgi:flagellar biosynthesis regulator FlaF